MGFTPFVQVIGNVGPPLPVNDGGTGDTAGFTVPPLPGAGTMGLLAWNYPSFFAETAGGTPASGVVYLMRIPLQSALSVTNILVGVSTAGSTLTAAECFAGLYDLNGNKIGGTADQSAVWTSAGLKTMALSGGPFNVPAGFCYVVLVTNGTTNPQFTRAAGASVGAALVTLSAAGSAMPFCTNGTGAIALPASLVYASNSSGNTPQSFWCGLS